VSRVPEELELWQPEDALARLDRYLRAEGFLGPDADPRDDRVADLYLGYGLAATIRRTPHPPPPEPARLPLVACRIRVRDETVPSPGPYRVGPWQATWTAAEHERAVEDARAAIAAGEIYQVNLVQHLSAPFVGDAAGLSRRLAPLRPLHPRPLGGDGWTIVSASPELFLSRRGRTITTMPIKGTRPSGAAADLRASAKDAAEHVMIVDLERNDVGRVSVPGSVRWPELLAPRSLAGVEHLVSRVTGTVRPDVGLPELLSALFPGGSVTGAPKVAAIDHIARLEPVGRGASMGALGTIQPNGDLDLALTIRTFAVADGRIHLWVGGGIVWDSRPAAEVEESWVKARPLLAAIGAQQGAAGPAAWAAAVPGSRMVSA
jgi:para-aminobenzoate synthetase component 1